MLVFVSREQKKSQNNESDIEQHIKDNIVGTI